MELGASHAINLEAHKYEGKCIRVGFKAFFLMNETKYLLPDKYTAFAYACNKYLGLGQTEYSVLRPPELPGPDFDAAKNGGTLDTAWVNRANPAVMAQGNFSLVKESVRVFDHHNVGLLFRPLFNDWVVAFHDKVVLVRNLVLPSAHGDSNSSSHIPTSPDPNVPPGASGPPASWPRDIGALAHHLHSVEGNLSSPDALSILPLEASDPRLLGTRQHRYFIVSNRHRKGRGIVPKYTELFTDWSSNGSSLTTPRLRTEDIVTVENFRADEKNWTPFEFQGELFFLSAVWPLRVVSVTLDSQRSWIGFGSEIAAVSQQMDAKSCFRFPWSAGRGEGLTLRGGTQAIPLDSNNFLAFFHGMANTSAHDGGALKTYTLGAVLFEVTARPGRPAAERISARITGLSMEPIAHRSWYEGPWVWAPNAYGMFDYIVFPVRGCVRTS